MSVHCGVAGRCGGCPWIGRPYDEQLEAKRAHLRGLWRDAGLPADVVADPPIASAGEAGLRDRMDVAWRRVDGLPVLGMWDVENATLVDVGPCPAASAPLRAFLQWLRADTPPIDRASLRLRVDPDGVRGLWIDAANVDVKALMDEGDWLRRLLAAGVVVEIGQRRKPLYADAEDGRLRLSKDVALRPWFRTWIGDRAVPLYGPVGGFSQPSLAANRLLVERVVALCVATGARRYLELGAGNGNLTLPLAGAGTEVTALELDGTARAGLERSAAEAGVSVAVVAADVHRAAGLGPLIDAADAVLADPPRSGLRGFVDALAAREVLPPHLVYVACHADSLVADAARLAALGYAPVVVEGVDQFPQSPHIEWLVRFDRTTPAVAD